MTLRDLGWDPRWAEVAAGCPGTGQPGRVVRVDRGVCTVLTAEGVVRASLGATHLQAVAADPLMLPCTGDWCLVRQWPDGPVTLEAVLRRRTALRRTGSSRTSREQVLAANLDIAAVVVALHPEPSLARIERLLTLAWGSGATPLVALTKADLVPDADLVADDVRSVAAGVEVVVCSTVTGRGIAPLRQQIAGTGTAALLGTSGCGKSSLTNRLVGAEVLATRAIRADGRGRHTTVRRELVPLPAGGAVIDTPGLRGVGLQAAPDAATAAFPDVAALAALCHFADCRHRLEPGCAVAAAVRSGALAARRLDSWQRLHQEAECNAARSATRERAERFARRRSRVRSKRAAREAPS